MTLSTWVVGRAAQGSSPGQQVYEGECQRCHGSKGAGTNDGPSLVPFKWSYEQTLQQIRQPACEMPSFSPSELSDEQIAQIITYLKSIK